MVKIFSSVCEKLYWIGIDYFPGNKDFLRFLKSHSTEDRIIRKCCDLKYLPSEITTTEIGKRWRSIFFDVCSQKGISRHFAKILWKELGYTLPDNDDVATRLENFKSDVYAYRDRWTIYRLCVCHAKFHHWLESIL